VGNSVFLIGYMGVGKSTLGKKLAQRLEFDFIDSDQFIEKQVGMSIPDYFAQFGEEKFRELERDFIRKLDINGCVVATGGGLPCFYDNMNIMNGKGVTIYLHRPPKELFQRLKNAKTERPLIAGLSDEELLDFISTQLEEREQFYNQAQFVLTRTHHTVEDLCGLVFEK
jgi:shikimate kinase